MDLLLTEKNDAQTAAQGANVAFIAGGVLAVAGVVLWLTAPRAPTHRAQVRFVPSVGPNGASVTLGGVF